MTSGFSFLSSYIRPFPLNGFAFKFLIHLHTVIQSVLPFLRLKASVFTNATFGNHLGYKLCNRDTKTSLTSSFLHSSNFNSNQILYLHRNSKSLNGASRATIPPAPHRNPARNSKSFPQRWRYFKLNRASSFPISRQYMANQRMGSKMVVWRLR